MTEFWFPPHECSCSLTHNQHKDYYETVEKHLEDERDLYDFRSPEERQKCIDTNELWAMHWYPNTPVGFNCLAAPTLEALIEYIKEFEND